MNVSSESCWFVGAGFSYDLGMPLVWELTNELREWLTPQKFAELNDAWRTQGDGHPQELLDAFAQPLSDPSLHYEQIIGWLQEQYLHGPVHLRGQYHHIHLWLVEMVSHILTFRHTKNAPLLKQAVRLYKSLRTIAERSKPLWIFSLNHDLAIELIAAEYGIALSSGITRNRAVKIPHRPKGSPTFTGDIHFDRLTRDDLKELRLDVLRKQPGINLIKLHGSLDIFAFTDAMDLVRPSPALTTIDDWINHLRILQEELFWGENGQYVRATNEIAYTDHAGEMQFLRRTLLSGAYKFESRMSQNAPPELLTFFEKTLSDFEELVTIGYSFGDPHINTRIRSWLSASHEHRLCIVDPYVRQPSALSGLEAQIDLRKQGATDFLAEVAGEPLGRTELIQRRFWTWLRGQTSKSNARALLDQFRQQHLQSILQQVVADMQSIPSDSNESADDFVQRAMAQHPLDADTILEAFLNSIGSHP